ncbi:uncharacterized protein LOC127736819 [Mytilus californianus]|uniref:uncharacterized protein LOC127736819 n=1 Tax=Mytilus californianus TaxID=6549 RepID=UPI0022481308|nr:uncharacterized protein LOC127736819 [Mytilus californianus]
MLLSIRRMFLYILGILSLCMKFIVSCSVHVCLTWEAKKGNITFKCKVSQLKFKVDFLNPKNEEQGYCISPIPVPGCYSLHNVITQDQQTNTTVLVIQRHVDNRLNGPWKCYHGTNVDAAIVNVTVIQQVIFKTVFKNDNCGEQHMAWTFIGVMIGVAIVFILGAVLKISPREKWFGRCCICGKICYYVTKAFIGMSLITLVIIIPFVSGLHRNSCKDKGFFIIFGVFMVFVFVIGLSIPRKEVTTDT